LPERLAKIFRMREMEEKETEEICKAMQITPTNCWVMLYRARTRMRECVEARWLTPGG
jgi:RNA polymerase sigma-70 factor (ECF subfamily)